jgi:hypothetical protein
MSTFYKESDSESTEDLYDKGLIYTGELLRLSQEYSCLVDFNFAEKLLYGKVNRDYISIEPNNILTRFTQIPNSSDDAGRLQVMSFVAEAFAGLSRHFIRSTQIGAIRKNDPYLSNLKAYAGYENMNRSYDIYFNKVITALSRVRDQQKAKINDFDSFLRFMIDFSKSVGNTFPITRTAFVRSRFNSAMNSGIAIEVADLSYNNDDQKIKSFIESPNFEYYLNACNSYGFMVDINAPWRLVADLDSVAMQGYASRYGYNSTSAVISIAFSSTHNSYFRNLPSQLLRIYNQISKKTTDIDECSGKVIISQPRQYTLDEVNNLYNKEYYINLYCMIRMLEQENILSKEQQDLIITDTINLSRAKDQRTALSRFERIVSQPFDYRGSLSYLIEAQRLREDT